MVVLCCSAHVDLTWFCSVSSLVMDRARASLSGCSSVSCSLRMLTLICRLKTGTGEKTVEGGCRSERRLAYLTTSLSPAESWAGWWAGPPWRMSAPGRERPVARPAPSGVGLWGRTAGGPSPPAVCRVQQKRSVRDVCQQLFMPLGSVQKIHDSVFRFLCYYKLFQFFNREKKWTLKNFLFFILFFPF